MMSELKNAIAFTRRQAQLRLDQHGGNDPLYVALSRLASSFEQGEHLQPLEPLWMAEPQEPGEYRQGHHRGQPPDDMSGGNLRVHLVLWRDGHLYGRNRGDRFVRQEGVWYKKVSSLVLVHDSWRPRNASPFPGDPTPPDELAPFLSVFGPLTKDTYSKTPISSGFVLRSVPADATAVLRLRAHYGPDFVQTPHGPAVVAHRLSHEEAVKLFGPLRRGTSTEVWYGETRFHDRSAPYGCPAARRSRSIHL